MPLTIGSAESRPTVLRGLQAEKGCPGQAQRAKEKKGLVSAHDDGQVNNVYLIDLIEKGSPFWLLETNDAIFAVQGERSFDQIAVAGKGFQSLLLGPRWEHLLEIHSL